MFFLDFVIRDMLWKLLMSKNYIGKVASFVKPLNIEWFYETTWKYATNFYYIRPMSSLCRFPLMLWHLWLPNWMPLSLWHWCLGTPSLWRLWYLCGISSSGQLLCLCDDYDVFVAFHLCGGFCVFVTPCHQ